MYRVALLSAFIGTASAFAVPPIGLKHNPKRPTPLFCLKSPKPDSEYVPPLKGPKSGVKKSSLLNEDQKSKKNGCCLSEMDRREKRMALERKNGFCKAMVVAMQTHLLNNGIPK